jgi:RNA 3'-terminal phosphate cyclase
MTGPTATPTAAPRLDEVFDERQAQALAAALSAQGKDQVTRAEFARLEALLRDVLAHLPKHEVTGDEVVLIAAAVTAYLGKPVRIRNVRRFHSDSGNAWSRQGRVFIQASHNLGPLKHGG